MRTFERYPVPDHSAGIKGIPKNPLNRAAFHPVSASGAVSKIIAFAGDRRRIQMLKIILVHDVFDNLVFRFIDHKRFAAACRLVSKTWRCLVAVLQSLFLHAAQNLARETDRIVFVHPFDNTLDQRTERTVDQWL